MENGDFPVPVLFLKFGKNTGVVAKDSSPEGNDGAIEGPTWTKGVLGPGLSFDGIDDYVTVSDDPSLRLTSVGTILAWFKSGGSRKNYSALATKTAGVTKALISYMLYTPATNTFRGYLSDGTNAIDIGVAFDFTDTSWHFIAFRWDGDYLRLSLDLVERPAITQTLDAQSANHVFKIGRYDGGRIYGIIDELRVYDVALSARQVRELYYGIE